jgi:hypothetical protein
MQKNWEAHFKEVWFRYEPFLFWFVVLVNLLPVLAVHYFYTGDGPAHSYNANIISSLLTNDNSAFAPYYNLRMELIPNMGGHTLLVLFRLLFGPLVAEKLVYLLCLVLLPLAFRFVIKAFQKEFTPYQFIVFLLIQNFCFYIGFQSFSIGLALMFYAVGLVQKTLTSPRYTYAIGFGLMLFVTAYFHLFAAVVALLASGILVLMHVVKNRFSSKKALLFLVLGTLPTIWFLIHFLWDKSGGASVNEVALSGKLEALYSTILVSVYVGQDMFTKILVGMLMMLTIGGAIHFRTKYKASFNSTDFALVSALLLLVLYFLLPDKMASGGFISIRLVLCALLFLALWLALTSTFSGYTVVISTGILVLVFARIPILVANAKLLDADAREMAEVLPFLEDGNTLVPLNYSDHWLHYNMGLMLGADKEIVVLDNYEAATNHFPVMWNERVYTDQSLGDVFTSNRPTLFIRRYEEATGIKINAVVRWMHNDEMQDAATQQTDSVLNLDFTLVFTSNSGKAELYLRKEE